MAKELREFPGSIEGTVRFDQVTCCALERGFNKNPEVVRRLEEILGRSKVKLFKDILVNSLAPDKRPGMKFNPTEDMNTAYSQIATRELERIAAEDEDDKDLSCGHSIDEHLETLESVVDRMGPTVN